MMLYKNLYNDANFKVICTNVIDEEDIFHIILPLRISKEIKGTRILFVAATALFTPFIEHWIGLLLIH